jgi:Gpi18-like mannosyltransferase
MKPNIKDRIKQELPAWIISGVGILVLACAFTFWIIKEHPNAAGIAAAALSLVLFVLGCLRFVPAWMTFWKERTDTLHSGGEPKHTALLIALLAFAVEVLLLGIVTLVFYKREGEWFSFRGLLNFWRCLDSNHYLDIAREWYVPKSFLETTEEWFQTGDDVGRVVQLVFLPGYPLVVYPFYRIFGNDVIAGLFVSMTAFPAACAMLYRLLRLDYDHKHAFRTVLMLLLLPGGFFFIAPMSESLYLLLALSALYCFRKKRYLMAGLFGAYCAFTRTVGLLLVAPLVLEWVRAFPKNRGERKKWLLGALSVLLVPAGFAVYLWINKTVADHPLQFLTYQHRWWSQHLGWFFNTASYQTKYLIECIREGNRENVFGLWLPNIVWHFGTLGLFAFTAKKLRPSYAAWFIAYFVIAIGATWLLSGPRYLLSMPVVAMMLAAVTEKRWQKIAAACVLAPLSILYLLAFVFRWQVW